MTELYLEDTFPRTQLLNMRAEADLIAAAVTQLPESQAGSLEPIFVDSSTVFDIGRGACLGLPFERRETGPTMEEMALLDDPSTIGRLPGMDNKSIKRRIIERDDSKKQICLDCSIREDCLRYAMSLKPSDDPELVFGGTTRRERHNMRCNAQRKTRNDAVKKAKDDQVQAI